jgi:hypothetical protein
VPDFASLERPRVAFVGLENRLYLAVPLHKAFSDSTFFLTVVSAGHLSSSPILPVFGAEPSTEI